ncbi:MAG TPA: YidC/Oxa1 family membrane protein insertase [Dehalococcoidia bacterium]|nr:YidC/Oxa1 family membrane protein insertase [Dehalococcoidia bacterium]
MDFIWNDLLVNPMTNAIIVLTNGLFDSFGLGIIAFTLIIRSATYPLTRRQLRTTRAMQEMQPRLQEIQKKYKDPKRRQEEMMKLYREVGFNPLGCAVPFFIQIPVWIALFQVIRRTVGTSPEALLSLSGKLYDWSFINEAVPLNSDFLFLDLGSPSIPLALMVAIATFYQQKFSPRSPARDERTASMNRTMLWMLPILFGWFTITVPSGLGIYWLITSLFSIVTTYSYNGRPGLSLRWFITTDPLPVLPKTATNTASDKSKAALLSASSQESSSASDEQPRRRRRRRRRSRSAAGNRPEGTETSHGTSET